MNRLGIKDDKVIPFILLFKTTSSRMEACVLCTRKRKPTTMSVLVLKDNYKIQRRTIKDRSRAKRKKKHRAEAGKLDDSKLKHRADDAPMMLYTCT